MPQPLTPQLSTPAISNRRFLIHKNRTQPHRCRFPKCSPERHHSNHVDGRAQTKLLAMREHNAKPDRPASVGRRADGNMALRGPSMANFAQASPTNSHHEMSQNLRLDAHLLNKQTPNCTPNTQSPIAYILTMEGPTSSVEPRDREFRWNPIRQSKNNKQHAQAVNKANHVQF